ncbi:MAG TPA: DUF4124 domain-containing protein [Chiayiivirga sp.]|nr:DUF4124 domain-containing protein [Chiayiivirga sp.]
MRILPIVIATAALLGFTLAHATDVYRWTDDKGVTHFADAPPQGVKFERVDVRTGAVSQASEEKAADAEAAKAKAEADAATAAAKAERCRIAESNLTNLRAGVAMMADASGQARYLTEDEQKAQIANNEQLVKDNCAGSDTASSDGA